MKVGIMLCNRLQILFINIILGHFERLEDAKNEPISSNWGDRNAIQHLKKGDKLKVNIFGKNIEQLHCSTDYRRRLP